MTDQTLTDLELHRFKQAIVLLNDYEMSDDCFCEIHKEDQNRYGNPPCLKCRTRQTLENVESILLKKTEAQKVVRREIDAMEIEFDDTVYHGRG